MEEVALDSMLESRLADTADQALGGMLDILTECASAENARRGRLVEAVVKGVRRPRTIARTA